MNWKINFWTIPIAISLLGGIITSCGSDETKNKKMEHLKLSTNDPDFKIPTQEAESRYRNYISYRKELNSLFSYSSSPINPTPEDSLRSLREVMTKLSAIQNNHLINIGVEYFHLPRYQVQGLVEVLSFALTDTLNNKTYALLSVKDTEGNNVVEKEIDLMFYVGSDNDDLTSTGTYYDFTIPCPPTCQPPPPFKNE